MPVRASRWLGLGLVAVAVGAAAGGCGRQEPAPDRPQAKAPPAQIQAPLQTPQPAGAGGAIDPRLHAPFKDAVLQEPPDGQFLPEKLKTGKSVGKLYEMVVGRAGSGGLWEQVKFTSAAGKRLAYAATLRTDLGTIRIELLPEVAPNHVRNFVALARAGYYDGLEFDRTIREPLKVDGVEAGLFECLEAGCPLGTGNPSYNSIGYWLRPEQSDKVKHEPGTVGAWHAEELETAGCRFYITLSNAPWMDGNWTAFGRVTQGLHVARAILQRPAHKDEKDRPLSPVVIRSVTIETREVE